MIFMPYNLGCSFYFDKRRALATGIATSGAGVGFTVMPALTAIVNTQFGGWRNVCLLFSGLNVAAFFVSFLYRSIPDRDDTSVVDDNDGSDR